MTELNEVRRGVYGEVGAEFGEPLTEEEVAALPEGARVVAVAQWRESASVVVVNPDVEP